MTGNIKKNVKNDRIELFLVMIATSILLILNSENCTKQVIVRIIIKLLTPPHQTKKNNVLLLKISDFDLNYI
jgi:hypothetical protein